MTHVLKSLSNPIRQCHALAQCEIGCIVFSGVGELNGVIKGEYKGWFGDENHSSQSQSDTDELRNGRTDATTERVQYRCPNQIHAE